jgi:Icc-related predicted phosphoesterase
MQGHRFRLLCVSDTHNAWSNLDQAAQLARSCDAVLVTGDVGVYNDETKAVTEMEAEHDLDAALRRLEQGHDKPVYFLPGNHDAPVSLHEPKKRRFGARAVNLHDEAHVALAEGLVLLGLGGSVPAYSNGYIVWSGFPFTEHQFGQRLDALWSRASTELRDDEQVVLATHVGPAEVSTTVSLRDPLAPIDSGSTNLRRLLNDPQLQNRVLLNVHGHTHDASGSARVGRVSVLNPGALLESRYAIVELRRPEGGKWSVHQIKATHLEK